LLSLGTVPELDQNKPKNHATEMGKVGNVITGLIPYG
jgi:hypothetical protein